MRILQLSLNFVLISAILIDNLDIICLVLIFLNLKSAELPFLMVLFHSIAIAFIVLCLFFQSTFNFLSIIINMNERKRQSFTSIFLFSFCSHLFTHFTSTRNNNKNREHLEKFVISFVYYSSLSVLFVFMIVVVIHNDVLAEF